MAAFTSKAAGNWSASGQTTWNQVGVPASGDTVTISHAITVDVDTVIGSSPAAAGTAAIAASANLTIAAGKMLTLKGDITLTSCQLILSAGSTLKFDASGAGTPSTARYVCQINTAHGGTSKLVVNGTSGSRCTITSVTTSSAAFGRFTDGGFIGGGQVDLTYCDLSNIGDSSNPAFTYWVQDSSGRTFSLQNMTADGCGQLTNPTVACNNDTIFQLVNVTTKNTTATYAAYVQWTSDAFTLGTRSITGCVFDKIVKLYIPKSVTVTGNLFYDRFETTGGSSAWASFSGNLVRWGTSASELIFEGDVTDSYLLQHNSLGNPHWINANASGGFNQTFSGNIFEYTGSSTDGDQGDGILFASNPPSTVTYTVKHNIVLPTAGDTKSAGTLTSSLQGSNVRVVGDHNTSCVTGSGLDGRMFSVGETLAGTAGMFTSMKSNLGWSASSGQGWIFDDINVTPTADVVTSALADYNGKYNLATGTEGVGYNGSITGSPGAHDVTGNPSFVDSARNLAKWDLSLSGAGTVANALTELKKRNDAAGYNSSYTIAALVTYVKAGFVPQSSTYQAAHDSISPSNGWIGAMQGVTGQLTPLVGAGALTGVAGRNDRGLFPRSTLKGT